MADVLQRDPQIDAATAAALAHIVSAITLVTMAPTFNMGRSVDEILNDIREQVQVILPR